MSLSLHTTKLMLHRTLIYKHICRNSNLAFWHLMKISCSDRTMPTRAWSEQIGQPSLPEAQWYVVHCSLLVQEVLTVPLGGGD